MAHHLSRLLTSLDRHLWQIRLALLLWQQKHPRHLLNRRPAPRALHPSRRRW